MTDGSGEVRSPEEEAELSPSRRRLLTAALAVFVLFTIAAIALFVVAWLTLDDATAAGSGGDAAAARQLDRSDRRLAVLIFVGLFFATAGMFVAMLVYGWDLMAKRTSMARQGSLLWFALALGGPIVAVPLYWWRNVGPGRASSNVVHPSPPGPVPIWSSRRKALFALLAWSPAVLFAAAFLTDAITRDQGDPAPLAVKLLGTAFLGVQGATIVWAAAHVVGRDDLEEHRRNRWLLAILFYGPIAVPLLWSRLVRRLPERA